MSPEKFWKGVGGRKMANGYLYALLITWVASRMPEFPFEAYALYLSLALLGTSAIVAIEDRKSNRPFPRRRAADPEGLEGQ